MGNNKSILSFAKVNLIVIALVVSGCITDQGSETTTGTDSTNGGQSLPPPDFEVPPVVVVPETPEEEPDIVTQTQGIEVVSANPTKDVNVNLKIKGLQWPWMKITNNNNCQGGEYEVFARAKTVVIPSDKTNTTVAYSVMFDDGDGNHSLCYSTTVAHDNKGPQILLKRYPAPSLEEGVAPEIEYEITDVSGVDTAGCALNGIEKGCPAGGPHVITMTALPVGQYNFVIRATDKLGNQSSTSVPWDVVSSYKRIAQKFAVQNQNKVDILIVIDNSGSMAYEQKNMAQRTSNLLSVIRGLDWRIGVTTTDPSNKTIGDGRLVTMNNTNVKVLTSAMPEAEAQRNLASTLQRTETGSSLEQGIYATYRAVERDFANEYGTSLGLIRPEAHFASVVISDEDESANGPKNDPHNLIKLIGDKYGGQKNFSFHSIITKPGDTACKSTQGYAYGNRYQTMSELTGGVIGSVCATDYAQQVVGIANGIRDLLKTMTLECQPIVARGITITKDGAPFSAPYAIEGVNLKFETELSQANYVVTYSCLK